MNSNVKKNHSKAKKNKAKKSTVVGNFLLAFLGIFVIAGGVLLGLLLGVVIGCVLTTKPLSKDDLYSTGKITYIYDSEGGVMETLKSENMSNSTYVSIDNIPLDLQHAFVAIEDERFYTHNGVDFKRTASAVVGFVIPGMSSHGGSTITQQLVKNVTGDDSRSVPRKIREQWRAMQLEKLLGDKDTILELYLNKIYFANNSYGVESAAKTYFGKSVSDLSLAECSFLAGITNNPAKYNPATTNGRQNAYKRQITILDNMLDQGYITKEQYIEALQERLVFAIDSKTEEEKKETHVYTYFVDEVIKRVRNDLMSKYGYTKQQANNIIYNQGIKIHTTQITAIQEIVDTALCNEAYFKANSGRDPEDCAQAAITVMNHANGEVVAIYGGYGEKTQSLTYNRATDAKRQPGSSIKPILVYGPLIDQKVITAGTCIDEEAFSLDVQNPDRIWPTNWDNKVHGLQNARYALMLSYNIPAATFFKNNINTCLSYLKKAGIDRTNEPYISSALGGLQTGVSTLDMASAYSAIANGGVYYEPIFYTKVYSSTGELLLDNVNRDRSTLVYNNPETPAILTSMLESVIWDTRATGGTARITIDGQNLPVAGKTGTTNDYKDYWFCGFSGYYTATVWYGYDNSTSINASIESGSAMIIWKAVMQRVHTNLNLAYKDLYRSSSLVSAEICPCSGLLATDLCKADKCGQHKVYTEYYIKGTEPTEYCDCHTSVVVCTECKDMFGKYTIATDKCIENGTTIEVSGTRRSDETYAFVLERYALSEAYLPTDWSYELSHEYCTACGGTIPGQESEDDPASQEEENSEESPGENDSGENNSDIQE